MLIASVTGYVALDLAGRVTAASGRRRKAWVAGSAIAMGVGIWSMHFVVMLAFRMPMQVNYDVLLLFASVGIPIGGSAATFLMSARERIRSWELAVASLFMGPITLMTATT